MKNIVLHSLESAGGERCIDLFERPDGSFGYEEFRREPEDQGAWRSMARYSTLRFDSEAQARAAAIAATPWLAD
ncbi:hypothetical protein BH10PSE17_BH10PSE17_27010 [soil metagenome]